MLQRFFHWPKFPFHMLAEIPLELRSRLGLALFALGRLADEVGVQPSPAATVNSLVAGLKDPFLFVVAGEVNAGKSMLLNGLFGEEFCPTSALPTTDKIRYFRHGFTKQEISFSPEIDEIRVPLPFLQDFHIVDTPGVNSVAEGHEAITEQFLPRADAVLFVLPVTNPWGAKCWEFLARIHQQLGKRIVLVLSQIDLRSEMEVTAILEHLQLCVKKFIGRELPIFAVSARQALMSRTSGVGKDELLTQSRFRPLEEYLNQILSDTNSRREKLGNTLRMAQILLGHVQAKLTEGSGRLNALGDALRSIGHEVQVQKTESWEACARTLPEVTLALTAAGQQVPPVARSAALAPVGEIWLQAAQEALETQTKTLRQRVGQDLSKLWRQTRVTMDVALGRRVEEPQSMKPEVESLRLAQAQLLAPLRGGAAWGEALAPVFQNFQSKQRWAWLLLVLGIGSVAGGWGLQLPWLLGVGVGVLLMALGVFWWNRKALARNFTKQWSAVAAAETTRITAAADVVVQEWLQRSFTAFSAHYRPLLEGCELNRTQQEASHQEVEAMRTNFAELTKQLLGP
jgi:small GTP-binding protein